MTKYKAGDLITVALNEYMVDHLNKGIKSEFYSNEIIKHEPAPEPKAVIIEYFNVYEDCFGIPHPSIDDATRTQSSSGRLACIKLTWNPNTRTVSAEVVE